MNSSEPLVFILLVIPVMYVSVFIHEVGHAIFGHLTGFVVTSLGVGIGRPLVVIPVRGIRVYFGITSRLQGITFVLIPQIYAAKWRLVVFTAGGILANWITSALSIALLWWLPWGRVIWFMFALVNAMFGLASLIPINVKILNATVMTDGALILQAVRWGTLGTPGPITIQTTAALRGFWLLIGDTQILQFSLLAAAGAWSQLHENDRAKELCVEADALPQCPVPSVRALGAIVRAGVELEAGRHEDAARLLDAAESDYRAVGHPIGLFLISLLRANARVLHGDAKGGAADIDILMADPLASYHPELSVIVLVTRLSAAIAMSDPANVERLRSEYESFGRVRHSAARDYRVYRGIARFYRERGEPRNAAPAYRRVLTAFGELAGMWADPKERASFLESRSALLAEAWQCAESLGETEDFDRLIAAVLATPPSPAEAALRRDQRLRPIAYRVMLGNVIGMIAAVVIGLIAPPDAGVPFIILALVLFSFTIVAAFYRLFDLVVGRFIPRVRNGGGAIMLLLACGPWYGAILLLLLSLLDFPARQ